MKRIRLTRTTILILLTIAALTVAVAPALAYHPPDFSFEDDDNNDGVPDHWTVRGRVLYVCDHPVKAYDGNCFMVFPANDDSRAAVFLYGSPSIVAEEVAAEGGVRTAAAAQNLQPNRAFYGMIVHFDGFSDVAIYGKLPGGTYEWQVFTTVFSGDIPTYPPDSFTAGYLVLPHYGTVGVDLFIGVICSPFCF